MSLSGVKKAHLDNAHSFALSQDNASALCYISFVAVAFLGTGCLTIAAVHN